MKDEREEELGKRQWQGKRQAKQQKKNWQGQAEETESVAVAACTKYKTTWQLLQGGRVIYAL